MNYYSNDWNKLVNVDALINELETRKEAIGHTLDGLKVDITRSPFGYLRIAKKRNKYQYYQVRQKGDTKGVYLRRDKDSVAVKLAQKDYNIRLSEELAEQLKVIDRFLGDFKPEKVGQIYNALHPERQKMVTPLYPDEEKFVADWQNRPYRRKEFAPGAAEYYTAKGERVRSKSEIMIADALNRFGVPYRYEYPINVEGLGVVHPDFNCLNKRTRQEYFWEHNGMMGNPDYSLYAVNRIEKYMLAGLMPGSSLILTFETEATPLSARIIELQIKMNLL